MGIGNNMGVYPYQSTNQYQSVNSYTNPNKISFNTNKEVQAVQIIQSKLHDDGATASGTEKISGSKYTIQSPDATYGTRQVSTGTNANDGLVFIHYDKDNTIRPFFVQKDGDVVIVNEDDAQKVAAGDQHTLHALEKQTIAVYFNVNDYHRSSN